MIYLESAQQKHEHIFFYKLKLRSQPSHLIIYLQSKSGWPSPGRGVYQKAKQVHV